MSTLLAELDNLIRRECPDATPQARRRVLAGLCARCGGVRHYVPVRAPGEAPARLADELAAGTTVAAAARVAGISLRHARRIKARSSG